MEWESDITRKKFEDALVICILCFKNFIRSFFYNEKQIQKLFSDQQTKWFGVRRLKKFAFPNDLHRSGSKPTYFKISI